MSPLRRGRLQVLESLPADRAPGAWSQRLFCAHISVLLHNAHLALAASIDALFDDTRGAGPGYLRPLERPSARRDKSLHGALAPPKRL